MAKRFDRPNGSAAVNPLAPDGKPSGHEVSAVVVNYNAGEALSQCVASLERVGVQEVVVVDNGSTDDSLERLTSSSPDVRVQPTGRNLGYGGGANYGASKQPVNCFWYVIPTWSCRPALWARGGTPRQ